MCWGTPAWVKRGFLGVVHLRANNVNDWIRCRRGNITSGEYWRRILSDLVFQKPETTKGSEEPLIGTGKRSCDLEVEMLEIGRRHAFLYA